MRAECHCYHLMGFRDEEHMQSDLVSCVAVICCMSETHRALHKTDSCLSDGILFCLFLLHSRSVTILPFVFFVCFVFGGKDSENQQEEHFKKTKEHADELHELTPHKLTTRRAATSCWRHSSGRGFCFYQDKLESWKCSVIRFTETWQQRHNMDEDGRETATKKTDFRTVTALLHSSIFT